MSHPYSEGALCVVIVWAWYSVVRSYRAYGLTLVIQGKTLTMIALILATKNDIPSDHSNSTLIGVFSLMHRTLRLIFIAVVPLSVLSNWEKQIQDHCVPNTLSYAVYYGSGRDLSAKDLQKYDVVVTTYQTVVGENSELAHEAPNKKRRKNEGSLFEVQWKVLITVSSILCIVNVGTATARCFGRGSQYQKPQDEDGPISLRS
jgi:hypothetical protein